MTSASLRQVSRVRALAKDGGARERRLSAQVSLREVAHALGTTPSTVHRWETGECRPSEQSALRWAKLLVELTGTPL